MSSVVFGSYVAKTRMRKAIDDATLKCIADCLGISDDEFKDMMKKNPRAVYIYRGKDAGGGGGPSSTA